MKNDQLKYLVIIGGLLVTFFLTNSKPFVHEPDSRFLIWLLAVSVMIWYIRPKLKFIDKIIHFSMGYLVGLRMFSHFVETPFVLRLGLPIPENFVFNNILASIEYHLILIIIGALVQMAFSYLKLSNLGLLACGGLFSAFILTPFMILTILSIFPFTAFGAMYLGGALYRREVQLKTAVILTSILSILPGVWWTLLVEDLMGTNYFTL